MMPGIDLFYDPFGAPSAANTAASTAANTAGAKNRPPSHGPDSRSGGTHAPGRQTRPDTVQREGREAALLNVRRDLERLARLRTIS